jgi:hypothetical protein
MGKIFLNYANAPKCNYLYVSNDTFIGFEEKLNKKEKKY